jgi:hypothetical protein
VRRWRRARRRKEADLDAANPYAPTQAPLADGVPLDPDADLPAWRLEGRTLIARNGATLPDVCLLTGEATPPARRLRVSLSWTPVWFKMIAVLAPLLAVFAYDFFRRTSSLEIGLSPAGRKQRRRVALLALGAAASGVGLFLEIADRSAHRGGDDLTPLLLAVSLIALVSTALAARVYRVVGINRKFTRLVLRPRVADAIARLPPPTPPG